jgi:ABC-type multidrug transport system ATPase subunit
VQYLFLKLGLMRPEKRTMAILNNVSSVVQPGRTTLLLGPPAAGKSTLLKALAGKLAHEGGLKVNCAQWRSPSSLPECPSCSH